MGNPGTTITGTLILGALTLKATDLVKYISALIKGREETGSQSFQDGLNGVYSLLLTAFLGIGVVLIVVHTQWASEIPIGNEQLGQLGGGSQIVLGLVISSFGSNLYDLKKAIDGSESASTPRIGKKAEERRVESLQRYFAGTPSAAGRDPSAR